MKGRRRSVCRTRPLRRELDSRRRRIYSRRNQRHVRAGHAAVHERELDHGAVLAVGATVAGLEEAGGDVISRMFVEGSMEMRLTQ